MRLAALLVALLAGCNGIPKPPTEVRIPVPVQCYDRMPDKPPLATDAELAKLDDYGFVIQLAKDRLETRGYIGELEAKLTGCVIPQ